MTGVPVMSQLLKGKMRKGRNSKITPLTALGFGIIDSLKNKTTFEGLFLLTDCTHVGFDCIMVCHDVMGHCPA